jgi:hypothetical protein
MTTEMPTLKTGRLICPPQASLAPLRRAPRREAGPAYEGMPDTNSPAQRTLHQSLLNRHIGGHHIYNTLRDYGFAIRWGHQPDNMPQAGIALALCHDEGAKLGVLLRTESGRLAFEDDLLQQGWHLLILEPSAVVQTPQDALDSLLAVMAGMGCTDLPMVDRGDGDATFRPNSLLRPIGQNPRQWRRVWRALRLPLMGGFLSACLMLGMRLTADPDQVATSWPSGMALRARIASVAMSPDGHALVALANGSKAFIPAHALRRNPERLHHLIVAWRQGKPLTLFATSEEHRQYGRAVGIRDGGVRHGLARPVAAHH